MNHDDPRLAPYVLHLEALNEEYAEKIRRAWNVRDKIALDRELHERRQPYLKAMADICALHTGPITIEIDPSAAAHLLTPPTAPNPPKAPAAP